MIDYNFYRSITTAELKFMKMAQGAKDDEDAQSLDRFSQMGSLDVTGGSTMVGSCCQSLNNGFHFGCLALFLPSRYNRGLIRFMN